jgi:hypothetical protein
MRLDDLVRVDRKSLEAFLGHRRRAPRFSVRRTISGGLGLASSCKKM